MSDLLQDLDIFDLLSERHVQLRKTLEELWNAHSDLPISNSEWFIISRIYQKQSTTITDLAKHVDITRQATHKFIRRLEEKGLVDIKDSESNKRVKILRLSPLGIECYEKYKSLKTELEIRMAETIGKVNMEKLKEILLLDWGIDENK